MMVLLEVMFAVPKHHAGIDMLIFGLVLILIAIIWAAFKYAQLKWAEVKDRVITAIHNVDPTDSLAVKAYEKSLEPSEPKDPTPPTT